MFIIVNHYCFDTPNIAPVSLKCSIYVFCPLFAHGKLNGGELPTCFFLSPEKNNHTIAISNILFAKNNCS